MNKFALIIAPVIWQKLPLPGPGYILENLQSNNIKTYLFDINIEIYNRLKKNKLIRSKWTRNYKNFSNQFYEFIIKNFKNYLFNIIHTIKKYKKLIKNDINFEISLILNYPLENQDNFKETIQFLLKNKNQIKKIAQSNPYIHYPGTGVDITRGSNFLKGLQKVNELIKILNNENIKYTNAYINNLIV